MTDRTCGIVENDIRCGKPHCARGMCKRHYYLWYNHDDSKQTRAMQSSDSATRSCSKCRRVLPAEMFTFRTRNGKRVPISKCRNCATADRQQWRVDNRERDNRRAREYRIKSPERMSRTEKRRAASTAGLDKDDVEAYYGSHDGLCDICGRVPKDKRLSVDHDHITGEFRGLLCRKCNSAIGFFDDNPEFLPAAIRYFERDISGLVRKRLPDDALMPQIQCQGCGAMTQRRGHNQKWCADCRPRSVRAA